MACKQHERFDSFHQDPVATARRLLGQRLVRIVHGVRRSGIIVETEAYLGPIDKAAHTYGGRRTARNESMWLGGGVAYVYFIYGMHYCMNVTCGRVGEGAAVLLRALEPECDVDGMFKLRKAARRHRDLCCGPARLTQAMSIDRTQDGVDLRLSADIWLEKVRARCLAAKMICAGPRIGVGYAEEWAARPLRFWVKGNEHVSSPRV